MNYLTNFLSIFIEKHDIHLRLSQFPCSLRCSFTIPSHAYRCIQTEQVKNTNINYRSKIQIPMRAECVTHAHSYVGVEIV